MSKQFQKGDKVQAYGGEWVVVNTKRNNAYLLENRDGDLITAFAEEFDSSKEVSYSVNEVARKSNMDKLTTLAKKIVDADLRNMIKVGWLDNSLNLTSEGEDVVLADYLSENKAKFGKLAEEELKEQRKDRESK